MRKCPRKSCNKKAQIDKVFGVLPCKSCTEADSKLRVTHNKNYSLAKSHRIQQARDSHSAEILQPYMGGKPNKDYFLRYPDQVAKHGVREELKKL